MTLFNLIGTKPISTILVYIRTQNTGTVDEEALGEAILKLPLPLGLKRLYPQAKITWCVTGVTAFNRALASLNQSMGLLDEIIENCQFGRSAWELLKLNYPLAGRQFDLIIDTQKILMRSLILRRLSRHYFISMTADYWLSDVKPQNRKKAKNIQERFLQYLSMVSGGDEQPPIVDTGDKVAKAEAAHLMDKNKPYIGFAPGSSLKSVEKRWPLEQVMAVAGQLIEPVFFLGPDEGQLYEKIRAQLPLAHFPLQQSNHSSIALAIECAKYCKVGIVNDTALAHMVAAAGVPLIYLSPTTQLHNEWIPPNAKIKLFADQYNENGTMNAIPTTAVIQALQKLLEDKQAWRV